MSFVDDDLPSATAVGTLLVVDDDEGNRDLLSRRLERRGHSVVSAEDGRRALELIASGSFDVVLLDVMMPEISGLEVLKILRRTYAPGDLSVIMATACDRSDHIVQALQIGANDYVTKPLDFPVVLARVQSQLLMRRAVDEAARLERRLAERNRELESVNARLKAANRRMERDLKAAARIQESFLPGPSPALPGTRCAWAYRPCEELAGDGLNAFPLDGSHSGLYVFDVCGHGVAASLLSVSLSRVMTPPADPSTVLANGNDPSPVIVSPADVADQLNGMFPFEQADQYVTMIYGVLDGRSGLLRYVSAGHPGLVQESASGETALFDGRGFPVGLAGGRYEEQTIRLAPGDRVYFYTDGVPEAMDGSGLLFGPERMLAAIGRGRSVDLTRSVEDLLGDVVAWCGDTGLRDDVSILAVEFLGGLDG